MNTSPAKVEQTKISFKEVLRISKWIFGMNLRVSKVHTITYTITETIDRLIPLAKSAVYALMLNEFVRMASAGGSPKSLIPYLGIWFGVQMISSVIGLLRNFSRQTLRNLSTRILRRFLYEKISELGPQSMENPSVHKLHQTVEREFWDINNFVDDIINGISRFVKVIATAGIVYAISPIIFLFILIGAIPITIIQIYFTKKDWGTYKKHQDNMRLSSNAGNILMDAKRVPEIALNDSKGFFDKKYWDGQWAYLQDMLAVIRNWHISDFFAAILSNSMIMYGYYVIFSNFLAGKVEIGTTGFQTNALWNLQGSTEGFAYFLSNLRQRAIRFKEVMQFFQLESDTIDGTKPLPEFTTPPKIEVKRLNFSYPKADAQVLKNINLTINPGEKIAIVGENGAGKSTLIKLISRLYNIPNKTIFIDKVDLSEYKMADWHKNLGVLLQDFNFYGSLTAGENISIGKSNENPNKEEIIEAAKKADAHEFISEYKEGYDTLMDESYPGGIRPSGGQKQKIAIARFFYRNAPIVIYDEPTAAIDAVAEYRIFNQIYNFFKGKTVILISHRFSTVRNADTIYVMDKGKFVEKGSHDQLLKLGGKYAEAFHLQAEGYQEADKNKDGKIDDKEFENILK